MSGRRNGSNRIRGPQSALTDFLASNNISAAQIHADYERRQREAQQQNGNTEDPRGATSTTIPGSEASEQGSQSSREKKRRREQQKAISKTKERKGSKKARTGDYDSEDDYDITTDMYAKKQPLPGQLENCECCTKRFTVTPYSKTGPGGGLLCAKCSKEQETIRRKDDSAKKRDSARNRRRQVQSNLLDGVVQIGSKHLVEQCLKIVGDNIHDIDDFGDLPPSLLDRLSQLLSKKRLLNSRTLDFFVIPDFDTIALYDCAGLQPTDFNRILVSMPSIRKLDLRCAGQFKDDALDILIDNGSQLMDLRLDAANLISRGKWIEFLRRRGQRLESLKLASLDDGLDDEVCKEISKQCYNLKRLKIDSCSHLGNSGISSFLSLTRLEHLSIRLNAEILPQDLAQLIASIGPGLRTLSLEGLRGADEDVLAAIRCHCAQLSKLRFSANDQCRDDDYKRLFLESANSPLTFVDMSNNRDVDYEHPEGSEESIGFASQGFEALMSHSGATLQTLNIQSCRHISYASFSAVFGTAKRYPCLQDIDVSFVPAVDTALIAAMIKCCPNLKRITAFACFNATGVVVPQGLALIGVPDQCVMVQEGNASRTI